MQHRSSFPQPSFEIGSIVLLKQDDVLSHVPEVSERRITGVIWNPQIQDIFESPKTGWHYVLESQEEGETHQIIAPESDIAEPVNLEEVINGLKRIVEDLEVMRGSRAFWEKIGYRGLPKLLREVQLSCLKILDAVEPKNHRRSLENSSASIDEN